MKKFLSLVLALVMTMSLVTISAGAEDFTDADDITYAEAVDVMSAVGVVGGYADGSFNPTAGLSRGAAAKIICNMILGPTTAGALSADTAPYSDVAVDNTYAGYIAYCAKEGIISGYADGTFRPYAPLTGYAFMKMLLGALGYDAEIEGYVGANWSINVAKRALNIGLDDGLEGSFVGSKALNREEACLYAFNALEATMVDYGTRTSINVGDITVSTQADASVVGAIAGRNYNGAAASTESAQTLQFCEQYFKNLKLTHPTDDFERPTNTWHIKTEEIGSYASTPDLTYTEAVKLGTIYTDLGLSANINTANTTFVMDGAASEAGMANDGATALSGLAITKGNATKIGGNGVLTEVYYTDGTPATAKIVLINTYGGEVTSARAATESKDANVTVTPMNAVRGGVYETEDYEVDDVVAYNYSQKIGATGVKNVATAEQVTGELTGYTAGKSVTVDGTVYSFNYAANISNLAGAVDNEVVLTLDQYGYVLDVNADATSTNYAVILKYSASAGDFNTTPKAKLLFTDGTVETVELTAAAVKLADVDSNSVLDDDLTEGDIVSYTINNKGKYTLTTLNDADTTTTASPAISMTTKGSSTINVDSVSVANGKTIFLVATKSGSDTVYTAYTGIANVPTVTVPNTNTYVAGAYAKNGTVATVVYINATDATITSASNDVVFVLGNSDPDSYDSIKGPYHTYKAIVNGEITTIETDTAGYATGIYTSMDKDVNGIATLTKNATISKAGVGTDRETNGSIGLAGNWFNYTDDCNVYYVDTDNVMSVSSINGISKDTSDRVYYIYEDGEVSDIVIVQRVMGFRDLLVSGSDVTVNDVLQGASNGGSDNAVTATVTVADGDVVAIDPAVSAGATVANITVTPAAGANGTVEGDTYVAATGDSSLAVTYTVTVVSETGVVSTGTYTVTVTVA